MKFREIDRVPVPEEMAEAVLQIKAKSGASLNSCYRGSDPEGVKILRKNGKKNQAELYRDYLQGKGNPANPPGFSTHELKSDQIVYPNVGRGKNLKPYQCGMDWTDADAAMRAGRSLKFIIVRPYASGLERHHLNFKKAPIVFKNLKFRSMGPRVFTLSKRLQKLGYLEKDVRTLFFGRKTQAAVKAYQKAHGLEVDGVVGPRTWANIKASYQLAVIGKYKKATPSKPTKPPVKKPVKPRTTIHKGIDVSEHNGSVDFKQVKKAGYDIVFARCSDGDYKDKYYNESRIQAIRAAGLLVGVYHYGRVAHAKNGYRSGGAECRMSVYHALSKGWGRKKDLRFTYDIEESNGANGPAVVKHICEFINEHKKIMGTYPIIYTMPGFWNQISLHMGTKERELIAKCPLWIAHWKDPKTSGPTVPRPWEKKGWNIWQYGGDAGYMVKVPGVKSRSTDVNLIKNAADLLQPVRKKDA